jgi:hypothetical protein
MLRERLQIALAADEDRRLGGEQRRRRGDNAGRRPGCRWDFAAPPPLPM